MSVAQPPLATALPPTPDSPPPLTPAETKLLDTLHAAIVDHSRANPSTTLPASPLFEPLPTFSSTLANLLPSPPAPHLPLHLLSRLLALRRGVPFPEALTFFHHAVPSLPADSLPAFYAAMINLLAKHHHFPLARDLLDEMRSRSIPVSSHLILALIRRYVRADMPSEAAELFRRMEDYGAGPPTPRWRSPPSSGRSPGSGWPARRRRSSTATSPSSRRTSYSTRPWCTRRAARGVSTRHLGRAPLQGNWGRAPTFCTPGTKAPKRVNVRVDCGGAGARVPHQRWIRGIAF
ncbi:hypothetical protein QYE76_039542 [Lolium multiflorum]|uniref:Pentatricopeptide repeat-containing protein n=1 Tax=Lolium multiflorum TaxID=4521 RepID=A0AAD8WS96_LOLMU|nr:hypothetical protein QYE76_039542 [Lolium multiflorum]